MTTTPQNPTAPNGDVGRPMSPGEVAAAFRVDRATVNRWADSGKLPSFRTPGGHRRFPRAGVEAALARR